MILLLSFVRFKCEICLNIRAPLGVKFGLKVLLRLREFTFRNSASHYICDEECAAEFLIRSLLLRDGCQHISCIQLEKLYYSGVMANIGVFINLLKNIK